VSSSTEVEDKKSLRVTADSLLFRKEEGDFLIGGILDGFFFIT
jgi:hypothetical protein